MIARHLLDQRAAAVVLKHNEIAHEVEKPPPRKDTLQHHLQLGHTHVGHRPAADRAPGLEPLAPARQRADAGLAPVRDHQRLVHAEQRRQLGFVGLKLLPGRPDCGVLVRRILEFDHSERQPVDEEHDVRPSPVPVLADSELVDRQPVVGVRILEIDNARLRPPDRPVLHGVLDRDAIDEQAMKGAIARLQRGAGRPRQLAQGVLERRGGEFGVQFSQGVAQPPFQNDLPVVGAFRAGRVRRNIGTVGDSPADLIQPIERDLLDVGFVEGSHCGCGHCFASVRSCRSSVNIKSCCC